MWERPKRIDWRREVRRGPPPQSAGLYVDDYLSRDRVLMSVFGVQFAFIAFLIALIVIGFLYYAQYSGVFRWAVVLIAVAFASYLVTRIVVRRSPDPPSLVPVEFPARVTPGDLRTLAKTLSRAETGLRYSQIVFSKRLADAFLEKVRIARSLSSEEVGRIRSDPERLVAVLGDEELARFVFESEHLDRRWPDVINRIPRQRAYAAGVARVLDRMEAWS